MLHGAQRASSGQGQANDRIVPGRPAGAAASMTTAASCPSRHSSSSSPPRTLCAEIPAGSRGRSRSIATQPSWSSPCGLPESHDQAHDSTTLNFKEWVAQLMHGS